MESPAGGPHQKTDGGLYDILDLILDRGLVIDVFVRVSLVGIELLRVDARVVVASVDTYLRFAEACNRLDLENKGGSTLPELVGETQKQGAHGKTQGALSGAIDSFAEALGRGRSDDDQSGAQDSEPEREREREPVQARRTRRAVGSGTSSKGKGES
jgi:hypothetical protein